MTTTTGLAPGSRVKTYDPRPWRPMADGMRKAGLSLMPPEHGPWDDEPDDIQWTDRATGYRCWMKRGASGGWNGYVEVGRDHPLWGLDYDDEKLENVEVHGGLTFVGSWLGEGDWWFGFDCGHAWDISPAMPVYGFMPGDGYAYRDVAYVQGQVTHLAHQLKELE